jgi:uncharacterized membrane protein
MRFKDLISRYNWSEIGKRLIEIYPDQLKNITGYYDVYQKLLIKNARKSNYIICIDIFKNEDSSTIYDVSIREKDDPKQTKYASEFESFSSWLGYKIDEFLLDKMPEIDIICHCLYEMTFLGYDDGSIRRQRQKLQKMAKDISNGDNTKTFLSDLAELEEYNIEKSATNN